MLLLALLGIGIGGFPGGGDGPPGVTVGAENQTGTPTQTPIPTQTPTPTPTPIPTGSSGGVSISSDGTSPTGGESGGGESNDGSIAGDGSIALVVQTDEMSARVANVMPGDSGTVTLNVTNDGNESGQLAVSTRNVTDFENGLTEPEAEVPDEGGDPGRGDGELSSHLLVRWTLIESDGDRVTLSRNDTYVPIGTLDDEQPVKGGTIEANESATALLEWKVPVDTGNEIQSDSVEFDVDFRLVSQ